MSYAAVIIPLEPVGGAPEEPTYFTDVVLSLFLETLEAEEVDGETAYPADAVHDAAVAAFALGSAVGVEAPQIVQAILSQTHPRQVDQIVEACRSELSERVQAARASGATLEAETFLSGMLEGLAESEAVDEESAHNLLSMTFEYGCVLAVVERSAAILVRNAFNREQEEAVQAVEAGEEDAQPRGLDPYRPLQEFARELLEAYEADIGWRS